MLHSVYMYINEHKTYCSKTDVSECFSGGQKGDKKHIHLSSSFPFLSICFFFIFYCQVCLSLQSCLYKVNNSLLWSLFQFFRLFIHFTAYKNCISQVMVIYYASAARNTNTKILLLYYTNWHGFTLRIFFPEPSGSSRIRNSWPGRIRIQNNLSSLT